MTAINRQDEAMFNQVMRRADWRFLLPDTRFDRSICFAEGLLAQAVAAVSDCMIDPRTHPVDACDLAVALNPSRQTLQAAWAALRPGGSCYMEWTSPLAGGPTGLRLQLESIGFTETVCYWQWPWSERNLTLYWLPVDAPHVVQYFMANRTHERSLVSQFWGKLLEMAWRMSLSLGMLAPLAIIARKPPAAGATVLDKIRAGWNDWSGDDPPDDLALMLLTGGAKTLNKIVGLVFADSDQSPCLVVKMARSAEAAAGLEREASNLRVLHELLPDRTSGVPRLLFSDVWAGQIVIGETALTGKPLYMALRRDTFRDLALKVTDWLAEMASHAQPCARSEWWGRLIETTVVKYEQNFGRVIDPTRLQAAGDILASLDDLPLVLEQRDCSPWNILIASNGDLVILDWESAEPRGLPVLDLVYFLTYLVFFLDGAMDSQRFTEAYRAALDPATFTGEVVAECQQRYMDRLDIDPDALLPLRLLTWMIHSQSEYRQLAAAGNGQVDPARLQRSLFVSLWEEELSYAIATKRVHLTGE